MPTLDLTHAPLFEPLAELDFGTEAPQDLTAGYTCRAFVDDGTGLAFIFRRGANGAEISLIFQDAVLLESAGRFAAGTTLDSFQRGRYFLEDAFVEAHGGRYFYLLDFVDEDFSLTLAASGVSAHFEKAPV